MGYVIAGLIVLLVVAGFVAFLAVNTSRRGAKRAAHEPMAPNSQRGGPPAIGRDYTPLGDTAEHAGEQTAEGTTIAGQDAERHGGTGRPVRSGYAATGRIGDADRGVHREARPERDDEADPERPADRRR